MLDEHELNESVRFAIVLVVMSLSRLTDLGELSVAKCPSCITESLERVLCLPGHDDVTDEPQEVALTR